MKLFSQFLTEAAASEDKLTHLEHAEDHPLNAGAEGYQHAVKTLHSVHQAMQGKGSDASITTKYDGSPSIVFGHHPTTGKFFVASKSAFNKTPKLNYSPEDVDRNHGHAPGLAEKLKHALAHLPKVAPEKGIYQGDVMHSGKKDVKSHGDEYHFTPNTITYTAKKGSPEGRKIANSKFGVVVHTEYKGKDFENMKATFNPNMKKFNEHPDVHMISPTVDASSSHFDAKTSKEFEHHMANAEAAHQEMSKGNSYAKIEQHAPAIKEYINKTVRTGEKPTVEGLKKHIEEKAQKQIDKLKTPAGKGARERALAMTHKQIDTDAKHINKALELHGHLQKAKDTLVHAIEPAAKGPFGTMIDGKESKSEGSVVTINGRPTKLVDRKEFSAANFARGDALKKQKQEPKEEEKHGVLAFGRMNPPTVGHQAVAKKVSDVASEVGASDKKIVVSGSQDAKKNPLTGEQKVKHAKRMFGNDTPIEAASKDAPTILHQAAKMHEQGIKHLHVVAGSDRAKEMEELLNKYNGKKAAHGEYNFKSITVHSSGERDPDSEGVEGMSASKMRELASSGNKKEFHKALPKDMDQKHKDEMYNDVRKGMKLD